MALLAPESSIIQNPSGYSIIKRQTAINALIKIAYLTPGQAAQEIIQKRIHNNIHGFDPGNRPLVRQC